MVARSTGGGGGGDTSNWFSPTWSSWSLTMEFSAWFEFGLEKAPRAPAALRTSLSALYGRSLRRDICPHKRDGRLVFLLLFLNLLYHRLLYISSNQSHIINKQFIHLSKRGLTRDGLQYSTLKLSGQKLIQQHLGVFFFGLGTITQNPLAAGPHIMRRCRQSG
jgi:hypothetical protein